MLENNLGVIGTGGEGNIRAQFLGNISTMAWTMPAKPHQSECFTRMGAYTLLAYHMPHAHLELERHAQGVNDQGPLCMGRYMVVESRLYAGKERINGLLSLGMGHLAGDMQQADNRVLKVISFDGLYPLLLLLLVGDVSLLTGLYHLFYVLVGRPPCVLSMREVGGGVHTLHMTGSSLHRLLPGGHHHHHTTNIVGVDTRHVT